MSKLQWEGEKATAGLALDLRGSRQVRPEAASGRAFRTIGQPTGRLRSSRWPSRLAGSQSLIHPILSLFQIRLAGLIIRVNLRLLTVHQVEIDHRIRVVGFELDGLFQSIEALINQRPILFGQSLAEFFRDHRQIIRMGGILGRVEVMILPHRLGAGEGRRAQSSTPIQ